MTSQFLRVKLEGGPGPVGELVPVAITGLVPGVLKGKIFRGDLDKLTQPVPPFDWKCSLGKDPVTKANYR